MKCRKVVHTGFKGIIQNRCNRNATKNGYCWQHHPDEVKKRWKKAERRLEATPFSMIHHY